MWITGTKLRMERCFYNTELPEVIFTLSSSALKKLLEQENTVTILYDENGRQLYPYEEVKPKNLKDFFLFSVTGQTGQFQLVRYLNKQELFSEITHLKNLYQ